MTSALQRARQLKDQKLADQRAKRHKEEQQQAANQRQVDRMKDVIKRTLDEFNGVNEIYFTSEGNHLLLCVEEPGPHGIGRDNVILRAWVDSHSYDNPNYDHKVTETELAYFWARGYESGRACLTEDSFVEDISNYMAKYV